MLNNQMVIHIFGDGFTLPLAFVDDFDPAQALSFVVSLATAAVPD
jgi:hypothetical protein